MKKVIQYMNFDWDDNLIFMPTKIIYFSKDPQSLYPEISVSTELFAKTRSIVGESSYIVHCKMINNELHDCEKQDSEVNLNLLDYELVPENETDNHSFRGFRDCERKFFLKDLKQALTCKNFGPSFEDFVSACSKKETARNVTIITARGHSPKTIYQGLKILQELELIKYIPLLSNIFPVSYAPISKKMGTSASNPSEAKNDILIKILDMIQYQAKENSHNRYCFGFSDDDQKTYALVEETIKKYLQTGRWDNVEISLYFTGHKKNERTILKLT